MHDDDSDTPASRSLSNGLAFLMLAAGFTAICTTGVVQLAAIATIFAAGIGSLAVLLPKNLSDLEWPFQGNRSPPPAEAETPAASPQPTLTPEKSWVASLDNQPRGVGRYH